MDTFLPPEEKPSDCSFWVKLKQQNTRIGIFLLIVFCFLIYIVKFNNAPQTHKELPLVVTAKAATKQVPVYIPALGNVTATYTVTIRSQINGLLMKIFYKEGQFVKKGDELALIDERPLLAQLEQYEGQLVRDTALLANALIDLKRYQHLWKQDSISQQTLATQESLVQQYQGAIEVDNGLIQSTKVKLMYCHIISPINGRVGLRLVDPGNLVQASDTNGLLVITTINPITVIFSIPEDDLQRILKDAMEHKKIIAKAYDRQQNHLLATGTLLTIDNQIDPTTGMVKLRATFDNKNYRLFPNQFVNINLLAKTLHHATVVPTAAIQHGRKGDFVFVLDTKNIVHIQPVKTGVTSGDDTVILHGLSPLQQIVTEGGDKLTNGAAVSIASHSLKTP